MIGPDGMVVDRLDELLATYMTPAMRAAGFRKNGRKYILAGPDGGLVLVQVAKNGSTGFGVGWTPIPAALRAYHSRGNSNATPRITWGLFKVGLKVPLDLRQSPYASTAWDYERVIPDFATFGQRFADVIENDAIPRWKLALTREYLETAEQADPDMQDPAGDPNTTYGGPIWTPLFLGIDHDDPKVLRSLLAEGAYRTSDDVVCWLIERLESRDER